ncbi:MAG: GPR endopeptidase [Clostridiales bacterium]|nr:GPR endopeptidase [Clostridiales bacterium]
MTTSVSVLGTDLALEAAQIQMKTAHLTSRSGLEVRRSECGGYALTHMHLTDPEQARQLERPVGRYITMELAPYLHRRQDFFAQGVGCLARELAALLPEGEGPTLVVGLGNRSLTADAVGPLAMSHILVTRHMLCSMPEEFRGFSSVAALTTGVLAETGLETSELVAAVAERIKPRCVIVLDALAARSRERLCAVLQLTDTGLTPGSGVGNHRKAITAETLGVPVLALGLPTVIRAEQLAGEETPAAGEPLFVTPRDIDQRVRELSRMMAYGVDLALQPHLTVEDVTGLLG